MENEKKKFYEKLMEDSLKDVKFKRNTNRVNLRTHNRGYKGNKSRYYTKNGMIRLDYNVDKKRKSTFLNQMIICIFIIAIFYFLSNSNLKISDKIIQKTKIMLNSDLKINDKINDLLKRLNISIDIGKKDGLSIDNEIIEEMEEEIEYSKKKINSLKTEKIVLGAENKWINPVDGVITGYFGNRKNPILKKEEFHNGLDIGANENAPVYAVKDGTVQDVGESDTYGLYIKYKTYDNYEIMYAHLNKILVEKDDKIDVNQKVGLVGNTGLSTGAHLHYTVLKDGKYLDPINFVGLPIADYLN